MKKGQLVLLLAKDESYIIEVSDLDFNAQSGIIKAKDLLNKKFGEKVRTHLGKEFILVKPNIKDFFEKYAKRLQQVILPKDASLILTYTGIGPGNNVIDVGTGSGWIAILLAYYVQPGKVYTYEKDERAIKIAKINIKNSGLKNIVLKRKDATKGLDEKNVDLVTIDMKDAKKVVKHAYKALKIGGWLAIYSPYIEQVIEVRKEIEKRNFSNIVTVENIVREWQMELTLRPKNVGLMHTGFLTFARRII